MTAILTTAKSVTQSMMWAMNPIKQERQVTNHLKLEFSSCDFFASHWEKRRTRLEIVKIKLLNTKEPKEGPIANLGDSFVRQIVERSYLRDFVMDMLPLLSSSAKYH